MTSHISELQGNIVTRISAGGSLRKEQTIHPLARFAYFEGANTPWEQRSAMLRRSSGNGPDDLN